MHEAEWENGGGVGPNVEAVGGVHPGRELRLAHGIWQFYLRPTLFVCIYIYVLIYVYVYTAIYMYIYIYICICLNLFTSIHIALATSIHH